MTRAELLNYAASLFAALADETGTPLDDSAAGLAYQLDTVIRATAGDPDNADAQQPLIEYYALRKFRYAVASRADFDATAIRGGRSQIFTQIDALTADAATRATAAGYPVAAQGNYGLQSLTFDYLEPEVTE